MGAALRYGADPYSTYKPANAMAGAEPLRARYCRTVRMLTSGAFSLRRRSQRAAWRCPHPEDLP
jgi:hypothetical protein